MSWFSEILIKPKRQYHPEKIIKTKLIWGGNFVYNQFKSGIATAGYRKNKGHAIPVVTSVHYFFK